MICKNPPQGEKNKIMKDYGSKVVKHAAAFILLGLFLVLPGSAGADESGADASGTDEVFPGLRKDPYSGEELKELEKLEKFEHLYRWGSSVYRSVTKQVIERAYLNEKDKILKGTREDITESRKNTEVRRMEAIKEFEAWIKRHPDDKRWTPDILFRLAELYYEKATVDFQYAQVNYQDAVIQIRRRSAELGRDLPEPPEPQIDYTISISYYRRLIREYPSYENMDVVHYLLGYCLREMAKQAEQFVDLDEEMTSEGVASEAMIYSQRARQAFLALVCSNRYKALENFTPPVAPEGVLEGSEETSGAVNPGLTVERFDPYKECTPIVDLNRHKGGDLQRRKALLSQAWFLLGEQHFEANPMVELTEEEKEQLKEEFLRHRDADRYRNDYQQQLAEKKEQRIKVHNYYAISAYTRIIKDFKGFTEVSDALYKRAWTYFRVSMYRKALDEFDKLLTSSEDEALRENAVRYVALCAYYQRAEEDKFAYLKKHYERKGWLAPGVVEKYPHVPYAFEELGKIFFEDAAPPPSLPGERNFRAGDLIAALNVYSWILDKGGFDVSTPRASGDSWKYFKNKAVVQKAVVDILYLLSINNEVMKDWPRDKYHQERRAAFNRFSSFDNSPHKEFAARYEELHGSDPKVKEALADLRETSLIEIANEYYMLGRQEWDAKDESVNEAIKAIAGVIQQMVALKGEGGADSEEYKALEEEAKKKRQELTNLSKSYRHHFDAAIKAYDVLIDHPEFKHTLSAYRALYFKADCLFYSHYYTEAAKAYENVVSSKISARYRLQALKGRVESYELNWQLNIVPPPPPNPAVTKKIVSAPIPQPVLDWHKAMEDLIEADDKKVQAAPYRFAIAYTYYRYGHDEKAYKLFWDFMKNHCDTPQAFYASQALLGLALIKNNAAGATLTSLKELDKERKKIAATRCGTKVTFPPKTPQKQMDAYAAQVKDFYQKMLGLAADIRMNRADALYKSATKATGSEKEKKYLQAATELEQIARQNPSSPRAAVSLYYAAEGYEQTGRFRKAKSLYEEIVENPEYRKQIRSIEEEECKEVGGKSQCRKVKKNQLGTVVNFLARAAWRAMEFEQAQKYYGDLAKGKIDTEDPSVRVYSYYWYARLLRVFNEPRKAINYYLKYRKEIGKVIASLRKKMSSASDAEQKASLQEQLNEARNFQTEVHFQVGKIYRKLNDLGGMTSSFDKYISQVASDLGSKTVSSADFYENNQTEKDAAMQMMQALKWLVDANRGRRRGRQAKEYEDKIVEYFDKFKMPKGENVAAEYAGEIAFRKVEQQYQKFIKRKLDLKKIRLKTPFSNKPKVMTQLMCELMGWGQDSKGRKCSGKVIPMLSSVVNPYVEEVDKITKGFMDDVGLKYLHPKWVLAVRARMGQVYAKATNDLESFPLPPEVEKFWKILWPFMQKYKVYPNLKKIFVNLMSQYGLDIDDEYVDMGMVLDAYKEKTYGIIRKNAAAMRREASKNYVLGLQLARTQGVSNEWTKAMRKGLADLLPDRYPFINDAKVAGK